MITISLTGRLTRDPELRHVASAEGGAAADVCEVRVAARDSRGRTVFLDCVQWGAGGRAAARHLSKGSMVAFTGELRLRESTSDGATRQFYSAVGHIEFLGESRNGEAGSSDVVPADQSEPVPF
jgi:single-stranded DNA-binding protein